MEKLQAISTDKSNHKAPNEEKSLKLKKEPEVRLQVFRQMSNPDG